MRKTAGIKVAALAMLAAPAMAQQLAPPPPTHPEPPPPIKLLDPGAAVPDWLTYGYDAQRSGWNRGETALTPKSVGRMKLLWSTQVATKSQALVLSTLTAPIVVERCGDTRRGTAIWCSPSSMEDTLIALDAATGTDRLAEKLSQHADADAARHPSVAPTPNRRRR